MAGHHPQPLRLRYFIYEGTQVSDELQAKLVRESLKSAGMTSPDQSLTPGIHVKHGTNRAGRQVHYYMNFTSTPATVTYSYAPGKDLLTNTTISAKAKITLEPWDLAIVEEAK